MALYKKKRRNNKIGAIVVHIVTIGFSSATTILLGWSLLGAADNPNATNTIAANTIKNSALILSALATAASSLEAVFDCRALWVAYNVAISRLKSVLARLNFLEAIGIDNLTMKEIEDLYTRHETICIGVEKDYKDLRTANDQ